MIGWILWLVPAWLFLSSGLLLMFGTKGFEKAASPIGILALMLVACIPLANFVCTVAVWISLWSSLMDTGVKREEFTDNIIGTIVYKLLKPIGK